MTNKYQNINFDLNRLPTMPLVAAQMMELFNMPDVSADRMSRVISKDAAVTARVLKIANSSFYSMSREVSSLPTAIVILGERTLRNLVLAASMRGMNQSFGAVEKMLWEDSMVCALGSRFLARRLEIADPEEAFMAGLFRHIGLVVLNNQDDKAGDFITSAVCSHRKDMASRERDLFGATHSEIGAAVLEYWKLSEILSLVALHHNDCALPSDACDNAVKLTALINLAGSFPAKLGIFGVQREQDLESFHGVKMLDLDPAELTIHMNEFKSVFKENRKDFLS
jgi:HD-like signal output (HDOD) protein